MILAEVLITLLIFCDCDCIVAVALSLSEEHIIWGNMIFGLWY